MPEMFHSSALTADNEFQSRTELNSKHVDSMVKALQDDPSVFETLPIKVWRVSGSLMIVDGFHRFAAFQKVGIMMVPVEIHETSREDGKSDDEHLQQEGRDALRYAIKANLHNGSLLKRTRADNQRAIRMLLTDPVTRLYSDSAIGKLVGVEGATVAAVRKKHPEFQTEKRIGTDGRPVNRELVSSNLNNRLGKKVAPAEATSLALSEKRPTTMAQEANAVHDLTQTRDVDNATTADPEAEEAGPVHKQSEGAVDAPSLAMSDAKSIPLDREAVVHKREHAQGQGVCGIRFSASDADELQQLREQFLEIRRLWNSSRAEILERHNVDLSTCDLQEFGTAIFNHTRVLMEEADSLKQQLGHGTVGVEAKSATKTKAKPAAENDAASSNENSRTQNSKAVLTDRTRNSKRRRDKGIFPDWGPVYS